MPAITIPAAMLMASGVSAIGTAATNAFGASSARRQMEFQERMSGTAHQREVADLLKAGLNPILSAKYGGASTPSGTMFTPENPVEGLAGGIRASAMVKGELAKQGEEIKNIAQATKTSNAQEGLQLENKKLTAQQIEGVKSAMEQQASQANLNSALAEGVKAENVKKQAEADLYRKYEWLPVVDKVLQIGGQVGRIPLPFTLNVPAR